MALFKRGDFYHFDFQFQRQRHQGSTFLKNHEKAKMFVNKLRTDLALGLVGLTHREPPPILSVFLNGTFLSWVRQNAKKPRTRQFYEERVKRLCEHQPFTVLRLDRIDELAIQAYKDARLAKRLSPATINGELRTLRKAMIFADDCGLIRYRRIRALPGERNREYILDGEMEARYLGLAEYPLKQVAILILDLGLRPEEAVSLRKGDVSPESVTVASGKTSNARRSLPQTGRTREALELCSALFPDSEWVFPGSKGKHFTRGALDNRHTALRKEHDLPAEFVLYSCRHTFGTRLAQSGANVFEIKKAMGHSSVKVSERYIHPSSDDISLAMKRKELMDRLLRGEVTHDETSGVGVGRAQYG